MMTELEIVTISIGLFITLLSVIYFVHRENVLDRKYNMIKENPSWVELQKLKKDINFAINNSKLLYVDKVNYIRGLIE